MNVTFRERLYQFGYFYHESIRRWLWGLAALGVLSLLGMIECPVLVRLGLIRPDDYPGYSTYMLAPFAFFATIWWLSTARWFSITYRELAYRSALVFGKLWVGLTTGWRAGFVLVGASAALVWAYNVVIGDRHEFKDYVSATLASRIGVVAALILIVDWAYRVRHRLVINKFADYTQDATLKAAVDGMADRLLVEIDRLMALYRVIDEETPELGRHGQIDATVSVENVAQALQTAIGSGTVGVAGMQISLNGLIQALGKALQGPSVSGSLHKDGGRLILTASLAGVGLKGNWRVDSNDLPTAFGKLGGLRPAEPVPALSVAPGPPPGPTVPPSDLIDRMVELLAIRILTTLAESIGSPKWEAVRYYTEGLRLYRDSLRTKRDKRVVLGEAERSFIHALGEDGRFAHCHYNLAILYRDLKNQDSARATLLEAVQQNPSLSKGYYALAVQEYQDGYKSVDEAAARHYYHEAIRRCAQALALRPTEAQSWDLRGLVQRELIRRRIGADSTVAARDLAIGSALAWWAMCWTAVRGRRDDGPRDERRIDIARLCTRNVAQALDADTAQRRRSLRLLRQAIGLGDARSYLHFHLGRVHCFLSEWAAAAEAFGRALGIEEKPTCWAYLAVTRHKRDPGNPTSVAEACRRALDLHAAELIERPRDDGPFDVSSSEEDRTTTRSLVAQALRAIAPDGFSLEALRVEAIPNVLRQAQKADQNETRADYLARLDGAARLYLGWPWAVAQFRIAEACELIDAKTSVAPVDAERAEGALNEAIQALTPQYPLAVQAGKLRTRLAEALLAQGEDKLKAALREAELGLAVNPEGPEERLVLGKVNLRLGHYRRAEMELEASFDLEPDEKTLKLIADTYLNQGNNLYSHDERRRVFRQVIYRLDHALELLESAASDPGDEGNLAKRSRWHFTLGRLHRELLEYDKAIFHHRIAASMSPDDLWNVNYLGLSLIRAKDYDEACETLLKASRKIIQKRRKECAEAHAEGRPAPDRGPFRDGQVHAGLYLAYAYALRNVELPAARGLCDRCEGVLPQTTDPTREIFRAILWFVRGLIALRDHKAADAVSALEKSVALNADAEAYLYLSESYLALARELTARASLAQAEADRLKAANPDGAASWQGTAWEQTRQSNTVRVRARFAFDRIKEVDRRQEFEGQEHAQSLLTELNGKIA